MTIYFGENLKHLRKERGITQEALAGFLGVSFQAVSKWERNESYPDITMLPEIADFFGVSVDDLLGMNKSENEQRINEYLAMYDTMHFKRASELFDIYKNAVKEFPNNFRILVRYMELLVEEKTKQPFIKVAAAEVDASENENTNNPYKYGLAENPEYERMSCELEMIYDKIQNHCTDDGIRIRSKHIMFNHLMNRYELSFDRETERWYCDTDSLDKAREILSAMPALCDARECLQHRLAQNSDEFKVICRDNIEELSYLLQEAIRSYCYYPYDNDFSAEYKINVISHINGIFLMLDSASNITKNRINLMYNYGHLGHLYAELGDYKKAIECLKTSVGYARSLDENPEASERIAGFYENAEIFKEMNMCERMRILITEHYPLPEEFRQSNEFKEIISSLYPQTKNS